MTHDVVVVGAGPVGLLTARLLGLSGHDVLVLERWPEPYPLPRAVHFDHEIGRILQSAELGDRVRQISQRVPDHYEWRNRDGEPLVRIDWSLDGLCGWPVASFFSQPDLEAVLAASLAETPNVTLSRGEQVVDLAGHEDGVDVVVARAEGGRETVTGRYVVGCDGANSFVRSRMDTAMTDLGFNFDWLIVDVVPHEQQEWSPMNWQLCDPVRPTTIVSGGPGRRRWEFMRLPGETREDLNTTQTAWRLLESWGRTPDNTTLERHAVYTFQARWADPWNQDRLILAGDAAHLMPPFAGQGMCSGLRDAANLAWKLDRVLRGVCGPDLLDTYTTERREHLQHAISMSVALGETICVLDEEQARRRDARMIATGADPRTALPSMPPERLGAGVWDARTTRSDVQGQLTPQPTVSDGARTGLLDDVLRARRGRQTPAFLLLGYGLDPAGALSTQHLALLETFGIQTVTLRDDTHPTGPPSEDADATPVLTMDHDAGAWFRDNGVRVVLVRPDFYAYGAVDQVDHVPELLDRLAADLTGPIALDQTTTVAG